MKVGFTTSVFAHIGAIAFGLVSLSSPKPLTVPDVEALPVEIVPIESITTAVQGEKTASIEKPPAPKPTERPQTQPEAENVGDAESDKAADAPTPTERPPTERAEAPAAQPEPAPEPEPTPEPEPQPEPEKAEAPAPEPKPEPQPEAPKEEAPAEPQMRRDVATPKVRPTPPKRKVAQQQKTETKKKNDEIALLLNKEKESAGGAKRSNREAGLGTKKGKSAGKLSQSELDALRGQIERCWVVGALAGHPDAETLRARVTFSLERDGTVKGRPDADASGGDSRATRTFAGSARRAVMNCQPYNLPADKYETWADVVVNFSLKDMNR